MQKKHKRIFCLTNESKICKLAYRIKNSKIDCSGDICSACEFFDFDKCVDYLLQEHKEPIKLKQWEYDLMRSLCDESYDGLYFMNHAILKVLKEKEHFKGVTDTLITIKDILSNYIIVSDDYDFSEVK